MNELHDMGPMARQPEPVQPIRKPDRQPMASKRQPLSRRIQIGLAKAGLGFAFLTGAAHHAGIGGPIGEAGAIPDAIGSTVVDVGATVAGATLKTGGDLVATVGDGLVKLANAEPQREQDQINMEHEIQRQAVANFFQVKGFQDGGEIEFDVTNLAQHGVTQDILIAQRLNEPYEKIDPTMITSIKDNTVNSSSKIIVDNPTIYMFGDEKAYQTIITTNKGRFALLIPEKDVTVLKIGDFKPKSAIDETNQDGLDKTKVLPPATQP